MEEVGDNGAASHRHQFPLDGITRLRFKRRRRPLTTRGGKTAIIAASTGTKGRVVLRDTGGPHNPRGRGLAPVGFLPRKNAGDPRREKERKEKGRLRTNQSKRRGLKKRGSFEKCKTEICVKE